MNTDGDDTIRRITTMRDLRNSALANALQAETAADRIDAQWGPVESAKVLREQAGIWREFAKRIVGDA